MVRGFAILALLLAAVPACDSGAESRCVTPLPDDCAPLYEPTFDNVYTNTIAPKCAQGAGACHGVSPGQGGLAMTSADVAWQELTGASGDRARVVAGEVSCSELTWRIGTTGSAMMPPGAPLSEAERCAIEKWVSGGAER